MIRRLQSIFSLVRFPNLLIIAFTQYAMRYLLMEPLLPSDTFELQFGDFQFALLVFSTMLIAAAGYIINDIYDVEADKINKPHKVIINKEISVKQGYKYYYILNSIGLIAGLYVANNINKLSFIAIFIRPLDQ